MGVVLASAYSDEAMAAVTDLPLPGAPGPGGSSPAQPGRGRAGQRKRHAQQVQPGAGWVPTPERFRDPSTRAIMRVWIDPADLSRHYVPERPAADSEVAGAMQGWRPVEELTRWGFANAQVVMANEAYDGLDRCLRTREVGMRMIRAAHEAGVRRLAMEALPWRAGGDPGPIRVIPPGHGGYLAQPEMRRLITTALELGWTLWAYDTIFHVTADSDPAELLSLEFTNWREREQAQNLCRLLVAGPAEPLLVWSGNNHASKQAAGEWIPMGCHFTALRKHRPVRDRRDRIDRLARPTPALAGGAPRRAGRGTGCLGRHGRSPSRPGPAAPV